VIPQGAGEVLTGELAARAAVVWVASRAGARDGCGAHLEGQRRPRNGTAVGKDVGREGGA